MDDRYYELTIKVSGYIDLFASRLQERFDDAIEIGEDRLIIRSQEPVDALIEEAQKFANILSSQFQESVAVQSYLKECPNIDWIEAYRASIQPVDVGRFYLYPSWLAGEEGKINIMIDPALAFGSGHHATTQSVLSVIARYVQPGDWLLDVGCGSGILGIAATKLGARVDACDTDPLAVENAAKNFENNQCVPNALWEGSVAMAKGRYDMIVANIVADVLVLIADDLKAKLKEGGLLVLSGILDQREREVEHAYDDLVLVETIEEQEWRTKLYRKDKNGTE